MELIRNPCGLLYEQQQFWHLFWPQSLSLFRFKQLTQGLDIIN